MPVNAQHPDYAEHCGDWELMRDTFEGQRKVKEAGTKYLPATGGQEEDGMSEGEEGRTDYNAYRKRAYCPDFVKEAVQSMVGLMHREAARIEVPEKMEPMLKKLTPEGESAWAVLRKINEHQLLYSRIGLLLDVPSGKSIDETLPFVLTYDPFSIINWDHGSTNEDSGGALDLVVLDESGNVRKPDFSWEEKKKFRVLKIAGEAESESEREGSERISQGSYITSVVEKEGEEYNPDDAFAPSRGGKPLDFIPFIIAGSNDLVSDPDDLPLIGLGELVLTIYRQDADYKQSLHFQGQDTLVVKGGKLDENARLGAGAKLEVSEKGDAKFIGTRADGLSAMRTSLVDDRGRAGEMTTRLFDGEGDDSSGRALNVRLSAKTASLNQIALTGAEALERILKMAAEWLGLDPEDVVVEPNMDFEEDLIDGNALLQVMQAKRLGLPWSNESIHRWLAARDYTEMTYDEEMILLEKELDDELPGLGVEPDENAIVDDDKESKTTPPEDGDDK